MTERTPGHDATESATRESEDLGHRLERHRRELTAHCYRMLGSTFEAEDAVQETLLRAWRGDENFEGRSAGRAWLYRLATHVCPDMLSRPGTRGRAPPLWPRRGARRPPA